MKSVHGNLFNEFPGVLHEMRPHYKRRLADMQDEVGVRVGVVAVVCYFGCTL